MPFKRTLHSRQKSKRNFVVASFLILLAVFVATGAVLWYARLYNFDLRNQAAETAAPRDYSNYWPMHIDNWWRYKQTASTVPCDASARTAWWSQPPDLFARGLASRVLEMRKTHDCIWNWVGYPISIKWHMSLPISFDTSSGANSHWLRQWGISRYESDPETVPAAQKIQKNDKSFHLPFNTVADTAVPLFRRVNAAVQPNSDFRLNNQGSASTQAPYSFLPFKNSAVGRLLDIAQFYIACGGPGSFKEMLHFDFASCRNYADKQGNTRNSHRAMWYTTSDKQTISTADIPAVGGTREVLRVKFFEVGFLDQAPANEISAASWIACEQWYYLEGVGPIKIEATSFSGDKVRAHPQIFTSVAAARDLCLNFDFNAYLTRPATKPSYVDLVQRIVLEAYKVDPSSVSNPRTVESFGHNSPQAASKFLNNGLMYIHKGKWWTYALDTGILTSTGNLLDVWGPSGSKAPAVQVNGQTKYPYSIHKNVAAVWGPNTIQRRLGVAGKQLILGDGAYWVNDTGASTVWTKSGLTSALFAAAPGFNSNGTLIYPHSNSGPDAIDETQNPNELIIINDGIAWTWNDAGFSNPVKLSAVPDYANNAPTRNGIKPFEPEAIVQFTGGQYLTNAIQFGPKNFAQGNQKIGQVLAPIPSQNQAVIFQQGRVWVNYHGGRWQSYDAGGTWP